MKIKTFVGVLIFTAFGGMAHAEQHGVPVYDVDSMSTDAPLPQQNNIAAPPANVVSVNTSSEQRQTRLPQQLENTSQQDVYKRIAELQSEVQALRGQVEELSHHLQELSEKQRDSHVNVEKQVSKVSEPSLNSLSQEGSEDVIKNKPLHAASGLTAAEPANKDAKKLLEKSSAATVRPANAAEEQAVYQTAFNLIKAKKYNEAIASLQKMLNKYPSGQFAANAHYWLGELYTLSGQHEQAASEFLTVVKQYSTNPRVADSELKLGLIYATQAKWTDAKASFNKIMRKFPGTASAQLAKEQLKQLKQAGH